jgi:hypothetical protein
MKRKVSAITAVAACLVWVVGPIAAEEASPTSGSAVGPVVVTGEEVCDGTTPPQTTTVAGISTFHGGGVSCTLTQSDTRVTGTSIATEDGYCLTDVGCVDWGTFVLTGPEGTWLGTFEGMNGGQDWAYAQSVATGTGAYQGWTYVFHESGKKTASGPVGALEGILYEGPPPPREPLPSPMPQISPSPGS